MKLYLLINKNCFAAGAYYGWAGDDMIAAVIEADSEDEAWAKMSSDPNFITIGYTREQWGITELKNTNTGKIHLLTYGSY